MNKQDVANLFDSSVGQLVDSMRHFHVFGTIDDAAVLVVAGTATYAVFRAPFGCKLVEAIVRAETLETADGTIDIAKAASGTGLDATTKLITTVVPTTAGGMVAATDYSCTLNADNTTLVAGETVGIVIGTVGEMTGLIFALKFERLN